MCDFCDLCLHKEMPLVLLRLRMISYRVCEGGDARWIVNFVRMDGEGVGVWVRVGKQWSIVCRSMGG